MKIGLLLCGNVKPDLLHAAGDYTDMFLKFFSDYTGEVELIVYDVTRNQYPSSIDEVGGYITTGSKFSVYDNKRWIIQFRDFVRILHERKKKFIGICFGHQMIAHALGGRVALSGRGWGVGLKRVKIIKNMTWMDPILKEYELFVSHKDQVEALPPGAVLLGENSHCPYSIFQVHDHFLSMQAHPEFEAAYTEQLMLSRAEIIGRDTLETAYLTMNRKPNRAEIANWMLNFIKN